MVENEIPCGFIAATGRRSQSGEMYLSSFLGFRPGSDPALPIALVRHENDLIRRSGRPVLLFTGVGSAGDTLVRCRHKRDWKAVSLGHYRVHAAAAESFSSTFRVEELSKEQWGVEANRLLDRSLLAPVFEPPDLEHFSTDPTGRRFLAVFDRAGAVRATAMHAVTSAVSSNGMIQIIPTLHYVRMADQNSHVLRTLLSAARQASSPIVTIPNTVRIDDDVARSAGLRVTPAVFAAYFLCPADQEITFRGTEFEIV